jgi:hypothetical protein
MSEDKFEPCYSTKCDNCGQSPTVTLVNGDGKETNRWDMCGVCVWGESDCIDPDNWNI